MHHRSGLQGCRIVSPGSRAVRSAGAAAKLAGEPQLALQALVAAARAGALERAQRQAARTRRPGSRAPPRSRGRGAARSRAARARCRCGPARPAAPPGCCSGSGRSGKSSISLLSASIASSVRCNSVSITARRKRIDASRGRSAIALSARCIATVVSPPRNSFSTSRASCAVCARKGAAAASASAARQACGARGWNDGRVIVVVAAWCAAILKSLYRAPARASHMGL